MHITQANVAKLNSQLDETDRQRYYQNAEIEASIVQDYQNQKHSKEEKS